MTEYIWKRSVMKEEWRRNGLVWCLACALVLLTPKQYQSLMGNTGVTLTVGNRHIECHLARSLQSCAQCGK